MHYTVRVVNQKVCYRDKSFCFWSGNLYGPFTLSEENAKPIFFLLNLLMILISAARDVWQGGILNWRTFHKLLHNSRIGRRNEYNFRLRCRYRLA